MSIKRCIEKQKHGVSIQWNSVRSVVQSCPTLCESMDRNPPGSSVHGILQARILEWVAIPFSRGSFQPRNQTWVSCIASIFFICLPVWTIGKFLSGTVFNLIKEGRGFFSGPVAKIPGSQMQGAWVWSLVGELKIPRTTTRSGAAK